MNGKNSFLLFTGLIVVVSMAGLQRHTFADPVADPVVKDIDDLRQERRDCLAEALNAHLAEFRAGRASVNPILAVSERLLEAELEIANKREVRMKAYASFLKTATDVERVARAQLNNGTGTRQEALVAKARRLKAEILIVGADE